MNVRVQCVKISEQFMFVFVCVQVCLLTSLERWLAAAAMVSMLPIITSDGLFASHVLE